ncbi:MAG: hypothetical protein LBV04_05135, partial [Deferribacteraceae bacterium]|nr:hypothetical protein [Deferribacteraceae bacterium]
MKIYKYMAITAVFITMLAQIAMANSAWPAGAITVLPTYLTAYPTITTAEDLPELISNGCSGIRVSSEVFIFAVENIDWMQQERFYIDKPYIDSFVMLTGLDSASIEETLASHQADDTSAKFISDIVEKMVITIMNSNISAEQKEEALSNIIYDFGNVSEVVHDGDTHELLDMIRCDNISMESRTSYYESGAVKYVAQYVNHSYKNGPIKYYNENGELAGEGTFIADDKPHNGFIRSYN